MINNKENFFKKLEEKHEILKYPLLLLIFNNKTYTFENDFMTKKEKKFHDMYMNSGYLIDLDYFIILTMMFFIGANITFKIIFDSFLTSLLLSSTIVVFYSYLYFMSIRKYIKISKIIEKIKKKMRFKISYYLNNHPSLNQIKIDTNSLAFKESKKIIFERYYDVFKDINPKNYEEAENKLKELCLKEIENFNIKNDFKNQIKKIDKNSIDFEKENEVLKKEIRELKKEMKELKEENKNSLNIDNSNSYNDGAIKFPLKEKVQVKSKVRIVQ